MLGGSAKACKIVMLRSHINCSKCVFALDTCCRINKIRPNIQVRSTVRQPSIVALLCDNKPKANTKDLGFEKGKGLLESVVQGLGLGLGIGT